MAWADSNLGLDLSKAAILQGVVAIGIAIGAVLAAAYVSLRRSVDVLPIGVLMGFSVAVMSFYKASWIPGGFDIFGFHISFAIAIACLLLVSVGMMAGFFVVPMNALLQHRGHVLMSAGRSIAVQNFNENSSILVMLGLYSLLIKSGLGTVTIMVLFGCFVGCSMLAVIFKHHHNQSKEDSLHLIGEDKRH